jgi:hypothetical protein
VALPLLLITDWRALAACRDADPEIFFPVGDPADPFDPRNADALAYCARCPVRAECAAEALVRIPYGVAGGMTAGQRAAYLRARRTGRVGPVRTPEPEREHDPDAEPLAIPRKGAVARGRGVELLAAGELSREEVAQRCGVSVRTVERWALRPDARPATAPRPGRQRVHLFTREQARRLGARAVSERKTG